MTSAYLRVDAAGGSSALPEVMLRSTSGPLQTNRTAESAAVGALPPVSVKPEIFTSISVAILPIVEVEKIASCSGRRSSAGIAGPLIVTASLASNSPSVSRIVAAPPSVSDEANVIVSAPMLPLASPKASRRLTGRRGHPTDWHPIRRQAW